MKTVKLQHIWVLMPLSFQGNIDFKKLKEQGVEFAMLRCGFRSYGNGILNTDSSFDTFAKDAIKNNIKIGA